MTSVLWRGVKLLGLLLLWPIVARAATAPAASDAAWEAAQRAAQAQNPPGVTCALRALNGQTRFQQGATIHLIAEFASDRPGYKLNIYNGGRRGISSFGTIHVAPEAGATDPIADWPPPHGWAYEGPGPPAPVVLSDKSYALPFTLNDWLRFDRPGFYRVYVTTWRVLTDTGKPFKGGFVDLFSQGSILETTSDILQLEIVPADPTWAHAQAEAQRARWADKTQYVIAQPRLEGDLEYLGTREAMQTIIERMGTNASPRSWEDETWAWQPALIGFSDRDWLIGAMERAMTRSDYAIPGGFVETSALLSAIRRFPRPATADATQPHYTREAQGKWVPHPTPAQQLQTAWEARVAQAQASFLRSIWQHATEVVGAKAAAARARSLQTLLDLAWSDRELAKAAATQARVPHLVAQLAPIFDALP